MAQIAQAIEHSWIATTINQSALLLGGLSGVHLLGLTLLIGSAWVSNLRLTGALFSDRPVPEVVRFAARLMAIGLALSITTGLLMFTTRVQMASDSSVFRLKMGLLVTAGLFQFGVTRGFGRASMSPGLQRLAGVMSLVLWLGVALAGCVFILFE